jgi:HD-like signal output (HDOD) protein
MNEADRINHLSTSLRGKFDMSITELTATTFAEWAEKDLELATAVLAVRDLPAMTDIVGDFLASVQDPDWTAKSVAAVIARDPAVTACVLKVANSSYYSFQRQVSSVENAVAMLGLKTVKSLVLAASVKSLNRRFGLIEKLLVEDSIGSALAARILAIKIGKIDPEEAFLAGLMRHIGKIAMNNLEPENYAQVIQGVYNEEADLAVLERKYFPYTHAAIGAALLDQWNFAPQLVAATLFHEDKNPALQLDAETSRMMAVINVAGRICRRLGIGQRQEDETLDILDCPSCKELNLDTALMEEVLDEVTNAFEETRHSFTGND